MCGGSAPTRFGNLTSETTCARARARVCYDHQRERIKKSCAKRVQIKEMCARTAPQSPPEVAPGASEPWYEIDSNDEKSVAGSPCLSIVDTHAPPMTIDDMPAGSGDGGGGGGVGEGGGEGGDGGLFCARASRVRPSIAIEAGADK